MNRITTAILTVAALGPLALALPAAPASAEVPTCRGLEATHVGTPGQRLTTTPGPDVVVTNGARMVRTLTGDDVVCATRARFVFIVPGGGDDVVDATGFPGANLQTDLGWFGLAGSSGDDLYVGGDQTDQVEVWSGTADDLKEIYADGGRDRLYVDPAYLGGVAAKLGKDVDVYRNDQPRDGVVVNGEEGRDQLRTGCLGCESLKIDLAGGDFHIDRNDSGRAHHFEEVTIDGHPRWALPLAAVVGNDRDNDIWVDACRTEVLARGGADSVIAFGRKGCDRVRATLSGGSGDDILTGTVGRDELRGGAGRDKAFGGDGSDLCRAEVRDGCER